MKREEIEKAAIEFAEREYEVSDIDKIHLSKGFYCGANWRISSVWHKAEKPDENKPCLVEYKSPNNGKTRYKVSVYCGYEWKELTTNTAVPYVGHTSKIYYRTRRTEE